MTALDVRFTAVQQSPAKGGWTYVVWPESGAFFRHARARQGARHDRRASVPELVDGAGDGTHKLPVKAEIRRAIGKEAGDTATVQLEERLGLGRCCTRRRRTSNLWTRPGTRSGRAAIPSIVADTERAFDDGW